jgi:hypothetical protein
MVALCAKMFCRIFRTMEAYNLDSLQSARPLPLSAEQLYRHISRQIAALPEMVKASALAKLAKFNDFTPENDPHREHDFLSFEHCTLSFFWKCDYYNKEMDGGSEDPADPDKTTRVGTLMLAEDY